MRRLDRGERRQHVLTVHELDALAPDDVREPVGQARVEPLVLEVVADVRQRRRREAELDDPNALVLTLAASFGLTRPRLYDDDFMAAPPQALRQLVRAPAAAAADGWERIGR